MKLDSLRFTNQLLKRWGSRQSKIKENKMLLQLVIHRPHIAKITLLRRIREDTLDSSMWIRAPTTPPQSHSLSLITVSTLLPSSPLMKTTATWLTEAKKGFKKVFQRRGNTPTLLWSTRVPQYMEGRVGMETPTSQAISRRTTTQTISTTHLVTSARCRMSSSRFLPRSTKKWLKNLTAKLINKLN